MTIHSFSRTMQVRRRMAAFEWGEHRVVLPEPIEFVTMGYFAALMVGFWVASRLPVVSVPSRVLPFHLYWLVPLWVVYSMTKVRFDGRLPHRWAWTWLVFHARPHRTFAGRKVTIDRRMRVRVRAFFDEHSPRLHKARIHGPARVTFTDPVWFGLSAWHRNFVAHPGGERTEQDVTDWVEIRP